MSDLDKASDGGLGLAFLLSEMRDFRKGLESRDERINGNIDGLRKDVADLSTTLTKAQDQQAAIQGDVELLRVDVHSVREDVDQIMEERKAETIRKNSAWSGPKGVIKVLTIVGGAAASILALINFGPAVLALFAAP